MRRNAPRGFTLIELLVSISVIALLIGLLLPTLSKALSSARTGVCLGNLHQIGVGWNMYLDDHQFFPVVELVDWGGVDWYSDAMHEAEEPSVSAQRPINPYIGSELREQGRAEIFMCPADDGLWYTTTERRFEDNPWGSNDFTSQAGAEDAQTSCYSMLGNSYGVNEWLHTQVGKRGWKNAAGLFAKNKTDRNMRELATQPGLLVLVGDHGSFLTGRMTREGREGMAATGDFPQGIGGVVYGWWHGYEVCNMAYLDGSAKRQQMIPGTAFTGDYCFYLAPEFNPSDVWVWARNGRGTPPPSTN